MSLERITIAAFVQAYGKRGLEFPGITAVHDVMHDKLLELSPRIEQWATPRQTAYYKKAIKYTASRMAEIERRRKLCLEELRTEYTHKQRKHFEEEVDSRLMCAAIIEEARKLPLKTQQMLGMAILGTSIADIAHELKIPITTVKSKLGRARRIIKRRMQ